MPNNYYQINLEVNKDPLDLRDYMYEGSLVELPRWLDNRGGVPFILDQGTEGACTGFGLAAFVNFLLHNRSGTEQLKKPNGASARMLYQLAKRYDEWPGDDYEGSSIRGAMKGWHNHGVCRESLWPYRSEDNNTRGRLTANRQLDALERPLGNYFRVRHLHLDHMHSALVEAGILYASASVHKGWFDPDQTTGEIQFHPVVEGGHAFAIVGYDETGFWIQNSWDRDWGLNGFGHLTYDDWLQNGYDCWVARMGVTTRSVALEKGVGGQMGRALTFNYLPHEAAVLAQIKPHYVNLENDGELSDSGNYQTDEQDVRELFSKHIPQTAESWNSTPRIVLYAHGGLNDEKASAARISSLLPYFLGNEIYPIHFMWETGIWETLKAIVTDVFRHKRFGGIWDSVKDRFKDLADDAIELAVRGPGRPIWAQMKDNAERASLKDHGADYLAGQLATYKENGGKFELHLVGYSAGSILLAHFLPILDQWGLRAKSLTLFAPACTTKLCRDNILPSLGRNGCVDRLTIFNLKDEAEQDDSVASVYNKSLLYLVSRAFERKVKDKNDDGRSKRHHPLLGMEKHIEEDIEITNVLEKPVKKSKSTVIYSKGGPKVRLASRSTTHGGFDNDPDTLNSTLRIIRGNNRLLKSINHSKNEVH